MPDPVKSEVSAVRTLIKAVSCYAGQVRDIGAMARAEARAAEAKVQQTAELRRRDLDRAIQALAQAQAALARCQENCGALQRAVAEARQQQQRARQDYE
ncbi:MAG: hypothetical protein ACRDNZ_19735, partial [Streptosporangiaceae bacterium]